MQTIAEWLSSLGLSDCAENDVDLSVLPDPTDQHLKDIAASLGHRLKMLRGIAELAARASGQTPTRRARTAPVASESTFAGWNPCPSGTAVAVKQDVTKEN